MKIFLQKVILVMQNLQILMRIFCTRTMTIKTCINYYLTIDAVKTCMEGGGVDLVWRKHDFYEHYMSYAHQ